MGIAGDPFICRGWEPKTRERDEWFERILRAGREARRLREILEAQEPEQGAGEEEQQPASEV